jgi:glycosyltransferase involved in cell wall biosynthesis
MGRVSVIVPARNEMLLTRTVNDIFYKAVGDIEVIVVLDGPTRYEIPKERKGLRFIRKPKPEGLLPGINDAVGIAKGRYLMKIDAHSAICDGFDGIFKEDCEDDWLVVGRRFTLDIKTFRKKPGSMVDYFYVGCPWTNRDRFIMKNRHWKSRMRKRKDIMIDEQMTIHGSIWFTTVEHFKERIGNFKTEFGSFVGEPHPLVFKTWLGGGKVMINKKVWYAHADTVRGETYLLKRGETFRDRESSARYWTSNRWGGRKYDFDWLIDRFWPLPNWPKNWRELYERDLKK